MAPLDKSFSEPIRREEPGKTPYSRNFLKELVFGPEVKKTAKPAPQEKKSVFSGKGIKPTDLKRELAKTNISTHLKKEQRESLASEISRPSYRKTVAMPEVEKHLKQLKKDIKENQKNRLGLQSIAKREAMKKEEYILKEKMKLLEEMKDPEV